PQRCLVRPYALGPLSFDTSIIRTLAGLCDPICTGKGKSDRPPVAHEHDAPALHAQERGWCLRDRGRLISPTRKSGERQWLERSLTSSSRKKRLTEAGHLEKPMVFEACA